MVTYVKFYSYRKKLTLTQSLKDKTRFSKHGYGLHNITCGSGAIYLTIPLL